MIDYLGIDEVMQILEDELEVLAAHKEFYKNSAFSLFYEGKYSAVHSLIQRLKDKYENS